MPRVLFALILFVLPAVFGLTVDWRPCRKGSHNRCKINEVNITPCNRKSKCTMKKGTNAQININFTPEFTTSKLETAVYAIIAGIEVSLKGLDRDSCKLTTCPTEAGKEQEYNYSSYIDKKVPSFSYNLRWKLWDKYDKTNLCCFQFHVSVKK